MDASSQRLAARVGSRHSPVELAVLLTQSAYSDHIGLMVDLVGPNTVLRPSSQVSGRAGSDGRRPGCRSRPRGSNRSLSQIPVLRNEANIGVTKPIFSLNH